MGRPYTGWDGDAKGKRAGTEKFVQLVCFLSGNKLWNNGTWTVRPMNNANAKARPSVHGTGRAADLSWRLDTKRRRGGTYADCQKALDFLVENADLFRIEEIHDYHYGKFGRGWRCDRAAWKVYDKNTIGSPGGDWIHVEISPEFADDPKYYDDAVKRLFSGEVKKETPKPSAPQKAQPTKEAAPKLVFEFPGTPIKLRSRNTDAVKLIQAALGVTVDGKFGPQTKKAVESFQSSNGLKSDGVVDASTWSKLLG